MQEREADVVVVGAGIAGASAAWQLARRGLRVIVLEQFDAEHARGSSHGSSRIFRLAYDVADYVRFAEMALPLWRQAEDELQRLLLWTTGGVDLAPPEELAALATTLDTCGVPFERLSGAEIERRFPGYAVPPGWEVVYQASAGVLSADTCRLGLLELASRAGAMVRPHTRVTQLLPEAVGVTVESEDGRYWASCVVVAAAAWANRLLAPLDLAIPMRVTREHIAYYDCPPTAGMVPFIWHTEPFELYGLPDGRPDRIKVGRHGAGPEVDPETEPVVEQARVDELTDFVRRCLPAVTPEAVGGETCLYASTPDDDFVLDRVGPIVLGIGFGGHGFKFGPAIGTMLADLVEGKDIPFRDRFARIRFAAYQGTAGATTFDRGVRH